MNKEFIPYEEAIALKELGFDEPCSAFYKIEDSELYYDTIFQSQTVKFRNNTGLNTYGDLKEKISAPLYQQAFRWLGEYLDKDILMYLSREKQLEQLKILIKLAKEKK